MSFIEEHPPLGSARHSHHGKFPTDKESQVVKNLHYYRSDSLAESSKNSLPTKRSSLKHPLHKSYDTTSSKT